MHVLPMLLWAFSGWMQRAHLDLVAYLEEENRVLRQHLPRRIRFTDAQRRRLAAKAKRVGRKRLREISTVVTPETLFAWYRRLIAQKYDGSRARRPGRPPTARDIQQLVLRMATDNPRWGYARIQGALANLGHTIGSTTVKRILLAHGIDPAPLRGKHLSWSTFLRAHWPAIAAMDFFHAEVLTRGGLVRYLVLFLIQLETRRVEIAGLSPRPDGRWMAQIARNLTDAETGFLRGTRYLIHDRDPLFTQHFVTTLARCGIESVKLPPRSPNLNAYAERFVRSVRSECLRHIIPLGERHLSTVLREYVRHYHTERNHQGIGNRLIEPPRSIPDSSSAVQCHERLGGLLRFYHRAPRGPPTCPANELSSTARIANDCANPGRASRRRPVGRETFRTVGLPRSRPDPAARASTRPASPDRMKPRDEFWHHTGSEFSPSSRSSSRTSGRRRRSATISAPS